MASLNDVVIAIEITNAKLGDIQLKIDAMEILMNNQALHNVNAELFFVDQDLHSANIDLKLTDLKLKIDLINENLLLINGSQGEYTVEETLANNEALYTDVRAIKEMATYQFIFLGVIMAFFIVILVIKGFFKGVSS